jgi:N-methylhydantoinase A
MRIGVDVGGTFTDLVAVTPDGRLEIRKVLSTRADPSIGLFRACDALSLPPGSAVDVLVHGTTIATNALLERHGARTALVTTAGFEDLLWLRRQNRASLYDLGLDHPPPLVAREDVVGAAERMGPEGEVTPLSDAEAHRVVAAVRALRPEAVAVAFLFAFRHPAHEQRVVALLRAALPEVPVVASHEVLPVFREYERFASTTAEAYLRPQVAGYVTRAGSGAMARGIKAFRLMTSGGGTVSADGAAGAAAGLALSGPVGGVVGARVLGAAVDHADLLTLDMGGTSADASLVQGGVARLEGSTIVGGVPIALPSVLIETVSAGGGSVAWVDEAGTLKVGPRSAGSEPGPACFDRGGTEPTVTDACLALGWLDPEWALADAVRLNAVAADRALARIAGLLKRDVQGVASGIVEVATAVMARALKRVSVARGVDPRRLTLVPFGGAGPLFGCALADQLGMRAVIVPPHPGVLSALGLAVATERAELVTALHQRIAGADRSAILAAYAKLEARVGEMLSGAAIHRFADCRFVGQGYEITVPLTNGEPDSIEAAFNAAHRSRFRHVGAEGPVEIVNIRVVAERAAPASVVGRRVGVGRPTPGWRRMVVAGKVVRAHVWPLGELPPRLRITGPAILAGPDATALIEAGWRGTVHASGAVILERV